MVEKKNIIFATYERWLIERTKNASKKLKKLLKEGTPKRLTKYRALEEDTIVISWEQQEHWGEDGGTELLSLFSKEECCLVQFIFDGNRISYWDSSTECNEFTCLFGFHITVEDQIHDSQIANWHVSQYGAIPMNLK